MKIRLTIGVLTCAAMLAILATVGGVTQAHADKLYSPDCNSSNSGKYAVANVPTFTQAAGGGYNIYIHWTQDCGSSSTSVEAELQASSDGVHWIDQQGASGLDDGIYATDSGHAGVVWSRTHGDVFICVSGELYRTHTWISGSDDKSAGVACP